MKVKLRHIWCVLRKHDLGWVIFVDDRRPPEYRCLTCKGWKDVFE